MNIVNYNGILVQFNHLDGGILDRCIRTNYPIDAVTQLPLYQKLIKKDDICYDIGSYIGTHSIAFAISGGIVHAFEGSPKNYDRCEAHCQNFNIITHKVALHEIEKDCKTRFNDCNWDDCGNIPYSEAAPEQQIKYVILEKFCEENNIPWPNFIKMDIEGMETLVLKGFSLNKILSKKPNIYIEKHIGDPTRYSDYPSCVSIAEGGFDFNIIRDLWGYNVYKWNNNNLNLIKESIDLNPVPEEMVCIHKDKAV